MSIDGEVWWSFGRCKGLGEVWHLSVSWGFISQSLGKCVFKKFLAVFLSASFYQKIHKPWRFKKFQGNPRCWEQFSWNFLNLKGLLDFLVKAWRYWPLEYSSSHKLEISRYFKLWFPAGSYGLLNSLCATCQFYLCKTWGWGLRAQTHCFAPVFVQPLGDLCTQPRSSMVTIVFECGS